MSLAHLAVVSKRRIYNSINRCRIIGVWNKKRASVREGLLWYASGDELNSTDLVNKNEHTFINSQSILANTHGRIPTAQHKEQNGLCVCTHIIHNNTHTHTHLAQVDECSMCCCCRCCCSLIALVLSARVCVCTPNVCALVARYDRGWIDRHPNDCVVHSPSLAR